MSIRIDAVIEGLQERGPLAVDDVSLEVRDGEFMVLVGPSGCGKSTLLKLIAGIEEVTDGRIFIGERDVTDLDPRKRDIAMVFQSYALYPHLSVRAEPRLRPQAAQDRQGRDRRSASTTWRASSASRRCWTASRASCPAASASAWRWAARSCASRRPS